MSKLIFPPALAASSRSFSGSSGSHGTKSPDEPNAASSAETVSKSRVDPAAVPLSFGYSAPVMHSNFWIFIPVLFLTGLGITMVFSASSALALKNFGSEFYFMEKQIRWALISLLAMLVCRLTPLEVVRKSAYPLLLITTVLLVAVKFSALGTEVGGAKRWMTIGSLNFQPTELTRPALIIYLAYSLDRKSERIREFSIATLPHLLVLGFFGALILSQPDFGSAFILGLIGMTMIFASGVPLWHLVPPILLAAPTAYWLVTSSQYRMRRFTAFIDPWAHASDEGYQIIHSLMAFGTGGLWGVGFGNGFQKLFYLPEPHTDFIFSVIGEETGLAGVTVLLLLYGLILWQGVRIALNARTGFQSLLAVGLVASLGYQVVINMGVTMSLLPTKGLTLPFISYGGSSLMVSLASIGLLMNIGAESAAVPFRKSVGEVDGVDAWPMGWEKTDPDTTGRIGAGQYKIGQHAPENYFAEKYADRTAGDRTGRRRFPGDFRAPDRQKAQKIDRTINRWR